MPLTLTGLVISDSYRAKPQPATSDLKVSATACPGNQYPPKAHSMMQSWRPLGISVLGRKVEMLDLGPIVNGQ